jgi:hypothetical protein
VPVTFTDTGAGLAINPAGFAANVSVLALETEHDSQLAGEAGQARVPRVPDPLLETATVCTTGATAPRIAWKCSVEGVRTMRGSAPIVRFTVRDCTVFAFGALKLRT